MIFDGKHAEKKKKACSVWERGEKKKKPKKTKKFGVGK